MIRAARGESIDEPSDLDKKLALLKKQVLSRQDTITTVWNLETQTLTKTALLDFWFSDLAQEAIRFNDLFLNSGVHWVLPGKSSSGLIDNIVPTTQAATQLAYNAFATTKETFKKIYFRYEWNTFRMQENIFDLVLMVNFVFSEYKFSVSYRLVDSTSSAEQSEVLLFSLYKTEYDHTQIHGINYQLANKVYDFIAAKLAEANTPPA